MKRQFIVLAMVLLYYSQITGQTLSPYVISSMGAFHLSGGSSLSITIGESQTLTLNQSQHILTQGFQQPEIEIITGNISSSVLTPGQIIAVPFESFGIFDPGNIFTAQLSGPGGDFNSPINIGTLQGNNSGTISATIPLNLQAGSHYRIRVVSLKPIYKGVDNGEDLIFNPCNLSVNAGSDESTFFGYSGDQTITRTAVVTGGTAPYIYTWSLSRPLKCNQINTSGDEIFTLGSCSNTTCPSSGSLTLNPVCLGSASTKVKLMDTADVCVTVIDANGCVATDCFKVMAEDARCFAGNSNITKVKVCHLTGSPTNPYVQICVPEEAVANLIAQGDYVGSCISAREFDIEYKVNVFPNPNNGRFNIQIDSPQESDIIISAFDLSGKVVFETIVKNGSGINMHQVDLESVESGVYLLMLKDKGSNLITKKLITIN